LFVHAKRGVGRRNRLANSHAHRRPSSGPAHRESVCDSAALFADYLLDKFPFRVEAIQTDNGSEFQTAFHWHLMDRGIRHIYIKPATPRLNGKVERSHRIDGEEFYQLRRHLTAAGGRWPIAADGVEYFRPRA
jgi:transposase InsO family protein